MVIEVFFSVLHSAMFIQITIHRRTYAKKHKTHLCAAKNGQLRLQRWLPSSACDLVPNVRPELP